MTPRTEDSYSRFLADATVGAVRGRSGARSGSSLPFRRLTGASRRAPSPRRARDPTPGNGGGYPKSSDPTSRTVIPAVIAIATALIRWAVPSGATMFAPMSRRLVVAPEVDTPVLDHRVRFEDDEILHVGDLRPDVVRQSTRTVGNPIGSFQDDDLPSGRVPLRLARRAHPRGVATDDERIGHGRRLRSQVV